MKTVRSNECDTKGYVINIQRFTVHDGPGIRTEFFMKGCPLRCPWCSNPESYVVRPQIGVYPDECIGVDKCGFCLPVCPEKALKIDGGRIRNIDREACHDCLACYNVCPSSALKLWGEEITFEKAMKIIRADRSYYEKSGGGVTFSGGEALLQWRFVKMLLEACREDGINTCVESALHVEPAVLDEVMPFTDLFISDIKQMDSGIHRQYTGVGNERILSNVIKLVRSDKPLILRSPIIPGFNDSDTFIDRLGNFILEELDNRILQLQLLRYRPLGEDKGNTLGYDYMLKDIKPGREEFEDAIRVLVKRLTDRGIPAIAGTTQKPEVKKAE